jgi:hypothetical protein
MMISSWRVAQSRRLARFACSGLAADQFAIRKSGRVRRLKARANMPARSLVNSLADTLI